MRNILYINITLLVVLPPLLIGSVHTLTQAGLGIIACLLALLLAFYKHRVNLNHQNLRIDGWMLLFCAAICFTWLQYIPLPLSLLSFLSPQTEQVLRYTLGAAGVYQDGIWQPISLAPPQTAAKLIRDLGAAAFYFAIFQWAHTRSHLRWIMSASVLAATAIAILIFIQTILGITQPLMGLYQSPNPLFGPLFGSPFINLNHLGAYALFNALLTLPLLTQEDERKKRVIWTVCLILLSFLTFASFSRGAIIAYIAGITGFFFVLGRKYSSGLQKDPAKSTLDDGEPHTEISATKPSLTTDPAEKLTVAENQPITDQQSEQIRASHSVLSTHEYTESRHSKRKLNKWLRLWSQTSIRYLLLALFIGLGVAIHWGSTILLREFSRTRISVNEEKIAVILDVSLPLITNYPFVGVGRGAMAMAWHRFSASGERSKGQLTYTHVESQLFQPIVDWGIGFGILFIFISIFLIWLIFRRVKGLLESSVLIALLALLIQNLVDFNLEFYGTAFPFLAILAALNRLQSQRKKTFVFKFPTSLMVSLLLCSIVVIIWLTPYAIKHDYRRMPQLWSELSQNTKVDFNRKLKELVRSHPSDYILAVYLTSLYTYQKPWQPLQALKWLETAQFLNPLASDLLMINSYILARLKYYPQAISTLTQAVELRPYLLQYAYQLIARFGFYREALEQSNSPALVNFILSHWARHKLPPDTFIKLANQIKQRFPHNREIYETIIRFQLQLYTKEYRTKQTTNTDTLQGSKHNWLHILQRSLDMMQQHVPHTYAFHNLIEGQLAQTQQKLDLAVNSFKRVIQHRPTHLSKLDELNFRREQNRYQHYRWEAYILLIEILKIQKQYEYAYEILAQARRSFQSHNHMAHLAYLEGQLLQMQGRLRYALGWYEEAMRLHPTDQYAVVKANLCWELSQFQCTLRIYRRLAQKPQYQWIRDKLEQLEKEAILRQKQP